MMPDDLKNQIEAYDPEKFISSASLLDNVVFGRVNNKHADGPDRVLKIVRTLLDQLGLTAEFLSIGLDFEVGTAGRRLTLVQRQKLTVARALLRRSNYFIFSRPLTALDARTREQIIKNILALRPQLGPDPAIVWVLTDSHMSGLFDRVISFDGPVLKQDIAQMDLAQKDAPRRTLVSV